MLAEETHQQARTINSVLEDFCLSSSKMVSKENTQIFFSKNVEQVRAKNIVTVCGFSIINNLSKYLGMPLLHNRVRKASYQ